MHEYTKSLSEERAEGITKLEALKDLPQSPESKAVINRIIQNIKETPLLIDISARDRNIVLKGGRL